jgi:hypothetical protein
MGCRYNLSMLAFRSLRFWIGLLFSLSSAGLLVSTVLPVARVRSSRVYTRPDIPVSLLVTMDLPSALRMKQTGNVNLTVTQDEVLSPVSQKNDRLVVISRMELPGVAVTPPDLVTTTLNPRGSEFSWVLIPGQAGKVSGTLWLYLDIVPGEGKPSETETLMAYPLVLNVSPALPIGVLPGRWIGGIGSLVGIVVCFSACRRQRKSTISIN